ncbi:MAG: HAD family hydrolase [Pseudomonadota bacterium]
MTVRIAMWSGPRNISTAMMRSWDTRGDCTVVDEPFYAAYLAATGLDHPMRTEILASQQTDWSAVSDACARGGDAPITYQKHMCQHMIPDAPLDWMASARHAFLIRPPGEVAVSFGEKWDGFGPEDLGFRRQAELFERAAALAGKPPPVVEARDVLTDPEGMLRALCAALDVPLDPAMLSWAPGRRETDGVWATHWYGAVERSTGFGAPRPAAPVPQELQDIVGACQPHYQQMWDYRLRPTRRDRMA